jgi:hypothetical protein
MGIPLRLVWFARVTTMGTQAGLFRELLKSLLPGLAAEPKRNKKLNVVNRWRVK